MSALRFKVGAAVLCNLGPSGWKLGRVIALHYREDHWPPGRTAPYQVLLDEEHTLIYVPADDPGCCREATPEDRRMALRTDALAELPGDSAAARLGPTEENSERELDGAHALEPGRADYRRGRCGCCTRNPRSWSGVELYSEHYRCAARNGLPVTQRRVDLGRLRVGDTVRLPPLEDVRGGFSQCPTLVRLPPGLRFADDGSLVGQVRFDPHRGPSYRIEFVAVSTVAWDDPSVGLLRLEIGGLVEANTPPASFDRASFEQEQQRARAESERILVSISDSWQLWERRALDNRTTCDRILEQLGQLRLLLEQHPRLDGGRGWVWLGGFHMNVHKLLENTLFECELYLGHALTFGDPEVRRMAEQNLAGCYQKRRLEAARFLWIDGLEQMMGGEWAAAAETFRRAGSLQDGWGWAVNYGEIWLCEGVALLVEAMEQDARGALTEPELQARLADAEQRILQCVRRSEEAGVFGPPGHPWAAEVLRALHTLRDTSARGADAAEWLESLRLRTLVWCAQVLGGAPPFPPQPRPRLDDARRLLQRLPGHPA